MLKVYGASDDLIELEGDIEEEFNLPYDENRVFLVVSDGTILEVRYTTEGLWKIDQFVAGRCKFEKEVIATDPDSRDYSDVVVLDRDGLGVFSYVLIGNVLKLNARVVK